VTFHQWVPSARSLRFTRAITLPMGITEVLDTRIALGGATASISSKSFCLRSSFSGAASITSSASATASANSGITVIRDTIPSPLPSDLSKSATRCLSVTSDCVGDPDLMPSFRKDQCNPCPHQARPDDGNALVHPAVYPPSA
jgi:hypothetical protein